MGLVTLVAITMLALSWCSMTRGIETHSRLLSHTGEVSNTVAMLAASARMGAATGEAHHAHRHFALLDDLDRQLAATLGLFRGTSTAVLRETMGLRSGALRQASQAANVLMTGGDVPEALALLDTARIRNLRDDHMSAIGAALFALHDRSSARLKAQKINVLAGGAMLLLVIALTLVQILRRKAVEADLRCCDARLTTLRAAMGSAMDMQNNLLNNLIYFRTKAEMGCLLDADDIAMVDREIETSRAKMAELCAVEEVRTRDIGGIVVIESGGSAAQTGMAFA